ncbi:dicer-like protein 1 [Haliotis rubra]|nr:dicer-like protein 1 [Haliotis rubra]
MNTEKDYQAHLESRAHRQRAAEVTAPQLNLGQIKRVLGIDDAEAEAYQLTKTIPRSYQVDLFCKTMDSDRVIFLPTGTGKTLVSVMTLSCMLNQNPLRPVLFLVDKVLLVLQQSKYIFNELGDRMYKRLTVDGEVQERQLKIATLCGNILPTDNTPLYKHDIIVSTAAYADNLLQKQQLRWEHFSLVVFDEAHHCVKNHPFNRLLEGYHRPCPPELRPKVLGLTASPAGRDSVENTVSMLQELFHNLGGASIAIVQGDCVRELKRYQSHAKLKINYEPFSDEEKAFRKTLLMYICQCYLKLSELCNIDDVCQWGVQRMQRDLAEYVEHLDNVATGKFVQALGNCQANSEEPQVKMNMEFVVNHSSVVLIALSDLDGSGIPTAVADLQTLNQNQARSGFHHAQGIGIECKELQDAMKRAAHSAHVQQEFDDNPLHISLYTQLLSTLTNDEYINWKTGRNAMALILVRERAHAHRLSNFLKQTTFASANSLKITSVVGHGSGPTDGGMKVKHQKRVLDGVKSKKYHIIVATSVAEEGVDIPECELVICMNPPNTVTTLVQMRGRARKKDSHFVILCKSSDEENRIQNILRRERFMMEAAQRCVEL